MRTKRAPHNGAGARRPLAIVAAAGLFIMIAAALAACSGSASSSADSAATEGGPQAALAAPVSAAASAAAPAGAAEQLNGAASTSSGTSGFGESAADGKFVASAQEIIYTAQLSIRATSVSAAVSRATSVVTAAGGYVSSDDISDDPAHPSQATATVTFKIPVTAYDSTLAALSGNTLGSQLSLTQQAQDVTQQVADVSSRVASDQAAIVQLRTLLKHAGSVGDLLSVQDQINSEETDLESMLAQQNALDHETSYATLTLSVVGPKAAPKPVAKPKPRPLAGWSGGLADGWHALRLTIAWLLTVIGTVFPFAIAVLLIGGLAWWGRRWARRRGKPDA
jgi:hypothetical protein